MKLIYTTKRFKFEDPKDLQNKMIDYLKYVDKQNADHTQKFCRSCGTIWNEDTKYCCDKENLEYKIIHKPTYEHLRPTLFGFAAFCGISISTIYKYTTIEGFDEVIEWFKTVLQMDLEQLLLNPFNRNVGGAKFVAINNFGWKDKTVVESTGAQAVTFVNDIPGVLLSDNIEETDNAGSKTE